MKPPRMGCDPAVAEYQRRFDRIVRQVKVISARNGRPITCPGAGCCACCSEPVYCAEAEVLHALGRITPQHRAQVKVRTQEWLTKVLASPLLQQKQPFVMDWIALKAPCPFLDQGRCSIYQDRPTACRVHMAVGPPEACTTDRLHQKFCNADISESQALLAIQHFTRVRMDHLGVWLARHLLAYPIESADAEEIRFARNET